MNSCWVDDMRAMLSVVLSQQTHGIVKTLKLTQIHLHFAVAAAVNFDELQS